MNFEEMFVVCWSPESACGTPFGLSRDVPAPPFVEFCREWYPKSTRCWSGTVGVCPDPKNPKPWIFARFVGLVPGWQLDIINYRIQESWLSGKWATSPIFVSRKILVDNFPLNHGSFRVIQVSFPLMTTDRSLAILSNPMRFCWIVDAKIATQFEEINLLSEIHVCLKRPKYRFTKMELANIDGHFWWKTQGLFWQESTTRWWFQRFVMFILMIQFDIHISEMGCSTTN